jgi:hypothetical protein
MDRDVLDQAIAVTWAFGRRMNPRAFTPGVRRFASHADLIRLQDDVEAAHIAALRARRLGARDAPGG